MKKWKSSEKSWKQSQINLTKTINFAWIYSVLKSISNSECLNMITQVDNKKEVRFLKHKPKTKRIQLCLEIYWRYFKCMF